MAKKYTRKHLGNLKALDKEQDRIRDKSRSIEIDFIEMINPQQLALSFLGNFLNRKIKGKKNEKAVSSFSIKGKGRSSSAAGTITGAVKHPLFKTLLKRVGISFLKWQAFNLALFAGKKIYQAIKEKRRKEHYLHPVILKKN